MNCSVVRTEHSKYCHEQTINDKEAPFIYLFIVCLFVVCLLLFFCFFFVIVISFDDFRVMTISDFPFPKGFVTLRFYYIYL